MIIVYIISVCLLLILLGCMIVDTVKKDGRIVLSDMKWIFPLLIMAFIPLVNAFLCIVVAGQAITYILERHKDFVLYESKTRKGDE